MANATGATRSGQSPVVTGMFTDRESAERAYNSLASRGYSKDDINVIMSDETRHKYFPEGSGAAGTEFGSKALEGTGTGAAIGGTTGALVGAGAGGATGGLIGALVGSGIPEDREHASTKRASRAVALFSASIRVRMKTQLISSRTGTATKASASTAAKRRSLWSKSSYRSASARSSAAACASRAASPKRRSRRRLICVKSACMSSAARSIAQPATPQGFQRRYA